MGASKALLATVVLTALAVAFACSTDESAQPVDRNDATAVWLPDSWPAPPLPLMALD